MWQSIQANSGSGFFVMADGLPLTILISYVVLINLFIFMVTSADSASFYVAMLMAKGNPQPTIPMRGLWGFCIGIISVILLVTGGMAALQTASIISALPFSIVMFLMIVSLAKNLNSEEIIYKGEIVDVDTSSQQVKMQ